MNTKEIDWSVFRGSLIFLGAAVVISAVLVGGSFAFLQTAQDDHAMEKRRLVNARSKYQNVDEEKQVIETYLPQFSALEEVGLVGEEHRLTWLETLRNAVAGIKLPGLRYDVSSREAYTPNFPVEMKSFAVQATEMRLAIRLLHEGDMLALFNQLDTHAVGLYSVSRCSIGRTRREFGRDPTRANLESSCWLNWYTLKKVEEKDGAKR